MLTVHNLCKRYGNLQALDDVSFEVEAGEVVGFLGPNGAGKTTTMRIITGFIPATSGNAFVDGLDVSRQALEVRRRVGYLPEHTPLYGDMRVWEYLAYRARLKGVSRREVKKRVGYVIERTWLQDRTGQLIETLSKGYRQRVGIADSMLGSPRLLILDEPTIGLDPNQVREVRKLLKDLSEEHTLLLSTHILSEVELVCSRAIIIANGRKVADSPVPALLERHQRGTLRLVLDSTLDASEVSAALSELDEIATVQIREGSLESRTYRLELAKGVALPAGCRRVCEAVAARSWPQFELTPERVGLEEIFVELTSQEATERVVEVAP